jgi:YD repeat-containing protein
MSRGILSLVRDVKEKRGPQVLCWFNPCTIFEYYKQSAHHQYASAFVALGPAHELGRDTGVNLLHAYDPLNRLVSSNQNSGQQTFSYVYDVNGNRWQQNAPQGGPAPQYVFDNNNHFVGSGVTYDAAGNTSTDGLGNSFIWDSEGRLIQVKQGTTVFARKKCLRGKINAMG